MIGKLIRRFQLGHTSWYLSLATVVLMAIYGSRWLGYAAAGIVILALLGIALAFVVMIVGLVWLIGCGFQEWLEKVFKKEKKDA